MFLMLNHGLFNEIDNNHCKPMHISYHTMYGWGLSPSENNDVHALIRNQIW